ncbi:MAG: transglutaminase [Lachnospiraceae bacterium]|nr:transglutaminase [Lachnospiraceae bacterium]
MIFTQKVVDATQVKFAALLEKAGEVKKQEILACLEEAKKTVSEDVIFAIQWIYANSPLSDMANYDFDMFKTCAEHGVMLRETSPFAKDLPEDIFLNYVLHIRVNEEELCDCRKLFHSLLADRVNHLSMHDAIIEANYWNCENVMYQLTDIRTISALGAYNSAYGRCGEESNFGVNVFRAIGIPARQIYTPRWAHCDDNHAWVEVYCDGNWYFLGACEPEEVLNKGWFTNASSRAMLIHSRCFGEIEGEEIISKVGMASFLNNLKLYAVTKKITVVVKDEDGNRVPGAQVAFGILNYSNIFNAAVMTADENGEASLTCGLGSLNIHVKKDGKYCEKLIFTPDQDVVEIVLKTEPIVHDEWQQFVTIAPKDQIVNGAKPTEEQKELCAVKTTAANAKREQRVVDMFDADKANAIVAKYGYSQEIYNVLFDSRSNMANLVAFLEDENYDAHAKEMLLLTLSKKDRRDVNIEILKEALDLTKDFTYEDEDLFYKYVVCPRAYYEPMCKSRQFILDYFTEEQKAAFKADPKSVWTYINETIGFDPTIEYGQITTNPIGALTVKNASPLSKKILFVAICRALGIMSRINMLNQLAEYYVDGAFVPVEVLEKGNCTIIFEKESDETFLYYPDFSIGLLVNGEYQTLDLENEKWDGNQLKINVTSGEYRVITDNRLPNGNLYANKYHFALAEGETKTLKLEKYQANLAEMLDNFALDEFKVHDEEGNVVLGSELTKNKAILMWLEQGKEPTEHILNEMLDQEGDFQELPADIIFMINGKGALENAKVQKVLATFPKIKVYYDSFVPNVETLARRMYVDPDKLPLVIVTTKELNAVYACSGYNVGSGDMLVKICNNF